MNQASAPTPSLSGHLAIMRPDHWFKNVFALPGVVLALTVTRSPPVEHLLVNLVLGTLSLCLIASSNYVINEILDAPSDAAHPSKAARPVPSGRVHLPLAWLQWLALMVPGIALATRISVGFTVAMAALWIMGCVYNVPPLRTKEVPYLDVLSESINNPLRLLAGWYLVDPGVLPPGSLQVSYWMAGAYFMAVKRYAEYRFISNPRRAAAYRASFAHYTEERLLTSIMFYAASAMLFFGIFIARYRLELILSFPFVALVMALYLRTGLAYDSVAQRPEKLYREPVLIASVLACIVVILLCLSFDAPWIDALIGAFPRTDFEPL